MPLRLLSLLLVVNFSTLLAGAALAEERASTPLRGPKSTDTAMMQRQLGPLSASDTLWRIAERVKPASADVSTYQVMYAIFLKNPAAFIDGNLNHLRPGAVLQLPTLREIRAVDTNVARAKSDADDRAWAERSQAVSRPASQRSSNQPPQASVAAAEQLQQLTELKDQFGNSMLMIEAIARENNQLKSTLAEVQAELLALQQQLGEDSTLQQQLTTILQQQTDILNAQRAQEQQAAEAAQALAVEQEQGPGIFNNPLVWVLAASIPALLILFAVVFWLKRRGQQTEAAVVAANSAGAPPADYKSPLPPLDDNNDLDDSGLFDIDESLLDDAFADNGDFADNNVLDDSLPDFGDDALLADDALLDDDILLDDDSLLAKQQTASSETDDDILTDMLDEPDLTDATLTPEFDANNILSDSDLNALLSAEDDDDAIIELDDDDLSDAELESSELEDIGPEITSTASDDEINERDNESAPSLAEPQFDTNITQTDDEIIELDDTGHSPEIQTGQQATDTAAELSPDDLLEEIELDIPEEAEPVAATTEETAMVAPKQSAEALSAPEQPAYLIDETILNDAELSEQDAILVEIEDSSEPLNSAAEQDELTTSQIASLVDDESFDRTELDAFAEELAAEGRSDSAADASDEDEQAVDLLNAELDELLQQVDTADTAAATDIARADQPDELADIDDAISEGEGPDLESDEDGSVNKPSEAALSVENPSKMLETYPELELTDEDFGDSEIVLDDDTVDVEITAADPDSDESLSRLDDSQFDNLLTELEAMAQTTASDSEELSLDVDDVFSPALDEEDIVALSDTDFVEIDNLLANSEQIQEDDGRFEQLNVDVGLDEFADVIGNDNPQDVDKEDNGFAAKLDLVRAYIEINDQDSAEQIITEILDSAAPEHVKTEAKALQKPAS